MIPFSHSRNVADSLREYGRGIAGGLMFATPLLYTMEVWWSGFLLHPGRILLYIFVTFGLLMIYNRFVGLRKDANLLEVAIDSMEEMGIGLLVAAGALWLTGRISADMTAQEIVGMVSMEAMTIAIGVSVGTAQLGVGKDSDCGVSGDDDEDKEPRYLPQVAIALCGAVLFAANVAATEEIEVIAMESSANRLLLIVCASLGLTALILHFAGFRGSDRHVLRGSFYLGLRGLITTYAVALLASGAMLYLFGKLDDMPLNFIVAQIVVLALPAVLGASAGRLLLQTGRG